MAGLSTEQLKQIVANSRKLCTPQADKLFNSYKGNGNNINESDDPYIIDSLQSLNGQQAPRTIDSNRIMNSNLPDAAKQSFLKQPPMSGDFYNKQQLSELENMFSDEGYSEPVQQQVKQNSIVNESKQQSVPQYQTMPMQQIDYNYIKHLVSEAISDYFSKNKLNENTQTTLKQIGLSEGKIKLVDNSGNVFSAELEFKGNINDRKKK